MERHFHSNIETVIVAGLSALIFFNVVRVGAAWLGKKDGLAGQVGQGLGALVHFGN